MRIGPFYHSTFNVTTDLMSRLIRSQSAKIIYNVQLFSFEQGRLGISLKVILYN